jgi:acyl-CoA reductase-like NAD-dependent aldehyde dehydrogenase
MRALGAWERSEILRKTASGISARKEELAALLSAEAGKPIRDARAEIDRGALTFRLAAEEAERMIGDPARPCPVEQRAPWHHAALPSWPSARYQSLQLPVEPRRP